jgi:SAM-dependent methyltransferase
MSGFSSEWLELREPIDHRSRDRTLLAKVAAHFSDRGKVRVIDLGAGTGSNLRAVASALPARQQWILVDHDTALLAAAQERIAGWADSAHRAEQRLEAVRGGKSLLIDFRGADLAAEPAAWADIRPDLVSAAALFDLVSESWIVRFTEILANEGLPLYTALNHDGIAVWTPAHPADAEMTAAFERHFGRDKGFGPSAGWRASGLVAQHLAAAGYRIEHGRSDWRLGAADNRLIAMLAEGWAEAVGETGEVPAATVAAWLAARRSADVACLVRHEDLFASPPR